MSALLDRLRLTTPILQAGMGGGIADAGLAAAVSEAGGLGTIGILDPPRLREELARARALTDRPVAINLLLPFARAPHWGVARGADAVITFWGKPARLTDGVWIHQCGSVAEAQAARAASADAIIAQGVEAGGHVRGDLPALELLERIRAALPDYPVLLAGGLADARDVRRALAAGADAVVAGTRFLLSEECPIHPVYKQRLLSADRTVVTELFGFGWPSRHRVIPNAATERWLDGGGRAPAVVRALNRLSAPVGTRIPLAIADRMASVQRPALPLFAPVSPLERSPETLLDTAPLYAGETVARIADIRPAGELVRALAEE
jgi:NAD(P)H-dependent flavin oxidoreductase YrpB (nitropropane dioxygenase family)